MFSGMRRFAVVVGSSDVDADAEVSRMHALRCETTCKASSRVGARMRAWRVLDDDFLDNISVRIGRPYASVFPEPYKSKFI